MILLIAFVAIVVGVALLAVLAGAGHDLTIHEDPAQNSVAHPGVTEAQPPTPAQGQTF